MKIYGGDNKELMSITSLSREGSTLVVKGKPTSWRGLDLLHFAGGKLVQKLTYAKAKSPLFEE